MKNQQKMNSKTIRIWNLSKYVQLLSELLLYFGLGQFIPAEKVLGSVEPGKHGMPLKCHKILQDYGPTAHIQGGPKKVSQRNVHITSSNIDRFSKFLHYNILQEICNKQSLNIPPHLKCVATLPCEILTS